MTDSPAPEPLTPELADTIADIFGQRDREHMQPTIDAFLALLAEHPRQPEVLYEVGGSYDTAGEEQTALGYYEAAGIDVKLLPYASTAPETLVGHRKADFGFSYSAGVAFARAAGEDVS